jgi:murein DD-endopeptidase MepM/ murein hydrolase activator NlpD
MMRTWNSRSGRAARLLVAVVTLSLIVPFFSFSTGSAPPVRADDLSTRIAAARQRQADLQRAIAQQKSLLDQLKGDETVARTALTSTGAQLDHINADQASVRAEIQTATDALHRVQARRDTLLAQLHELDWTLSLLEGQIAQGTDDLQAQQRALGQHLADAYRTQGTSLIDQLLSSGSFTDVLSTTSAYLAYGDQDVELARSIAADQASLDSLQVQVAATRYRTDQLRRDSESAEADLQAQQAKLSAARQKLDALEAKTTKIQGSQRAAFNRINDTQDKVNAYLAKAAQAEQKLQKQIQGLIKEAERRAAAREARQRQRQRNQSLGGGGNGYFNWPTTGVITQEFGCTGFSWEPSYGSCAHFHRGIDIANGTGTPIHAAASGVVAFVGFNPFDGAFIVDIGHANGLDTMYVHLEGIYVVHAGQFVHAGQLVGYMGNTGHSTGTHLHWQVNRNGRPLNPRAYV